jgi:hypothetical protein
MTIQEAAKQILEEEQRPLNSREIANRALERKMVFSNSKNPIFSHATTILIFMAKSNSPPMLN